MPINVIPPLVNISVLLKYTVRVLPIDNIDYIFTHILENGTTCTVYYDKPNSHIYLLSVISANAAAKIEYLPRDGFILMNTTTNRHYLGYRLSDFIKDDPISLYQAIDDCADIINDYKMSLNLFVIENNVYENHY